MPTWSEIVELREKKKVRNRTAQKNYRENIKRKIAQLEQQVATQSELLALKDGGRPYQAYGTSFEPASSIRVTGNSPPRSSEQGTRISHSLDVSNVGIVPNTAIESPTWGFEAYEIIDPLKAPDGAYNDSSIHSEQSRNLSNWTGMDISISPVSKNQKEQLSTCALSEGGLESRIKGLLCCAKEAGFEDLDSTLMAYYTHKFDEGTTFSASQRLSRRRRLPMLLETLRIDSASWTSWEVQTYRDEIFKAAESFLVTELRTLASSDSNPCMKMTIIDGLNEQNRNYLLRTFQDKKPRYQIYGL
ncbi:BZIP domain-containing transcription factor [Pyrenophora tritici-repentis]|nr:BZIP domain-containing transcription factor [Pyrenophora tritici-repentis]KAI0569873.1 BZIP domain-containing transcription factor [Pyrenophora tritici-repentis]PZC89444.1 hypothetical protein A1F95_10288 [Pyrenophora tritici-repentis]